MSSPVCPLTHKTCHSACAWYQQEQGLCSVAVIASQIKPAKKLVAKAVKTGAFSNTIAKGNKRVRV